MSFQAFIEQLSKDSRFDRKRLQKIYEDHIFSKKEARLSRYENTFQAEWDDWAKEKGTVDISEFFLKRGEKLLRGWLSNFFPFYTSNKRLILGIKKGGTYEDFIIDVFYRFSQEELESVDLSLSNNRIDLTRRSALTRIILESLLAMRPIISKIVGYKYSLMIEESKFLKKANGRILFLEIVARSQE